MLALLDGCDPRVVGTPPLGLDIATSDIDIVCHAPAPDRLAERLWPALSMRAGFGCHQWISAGRPLIVRFEAEGWPFEIFASPSPVDDQPGWRHFAVERRLLDLGGAVLHADVLARRRAGAKTEPAFAAALQLPGDPYRALLDLARTGDAHLTALLATCRA